MGSVCHGSIVLLLLVEGLSFTLEFGYKLVLLSYLEMELTELILKNLGQVSWIFRVVLLSTLTGCWSIFRVFCLVFRDQEVLFFDLFHLLSHGVIRFLDKILATREDLRLRIQVLDLVILILHGFLLLSDLECLVIVLGSKSIHFTEKRLVFHLENLEFFFQICDGALSCLNLFLLLGKFGLKLLNQVILLLKHSYCHLILSVRLFGLLCLLDGQQSVLGCLSFLFDSGFFIELLCYLSGLQLVLQILKSLFLVLGSLHQFVTLRDSSAQLFEFLL